jgi:pimeloyl-ACP methyl ester carboxylesterase
MEKLVRDGVTLAFEQAGSGDPALLLVHCWCCDHTFLEPQFQHFKGRHRVISVDLRGHGESDKPQQEYTLAGFAEDVVWLCGELGVTKPVAIGHSMGGNTVLELAARHPEFPTAIVMIDSGIIPPPPLQEALNQASKALRGPDFRQVISGLGESITLATDEPQRKQRLLGVMASAPQHVMSSAFDHHLVLWDGAAATACKVPALYIGAQQPLTDLDRMRQLCPQLLTGQTVGAGHFNNQEVPDQVNGMIERFLATSLRKTEQ